MIDKNRAHLQRALQMANLAYSKLAGTTPAMLTQENIDLTSDTLDIVRDALHEVLYPALVCAHCGRKYDLCDLTATEANAISTGGACLSDDCPENKS